MALPNVTVEIAFDSGYTTPAASRTWTDVSAYVEGAQALTINRGRADEVSQVQPSRLALTLNNADGRFTPRLTTGAYYPDVKKGRPVRVSTSLMSNATFDAGVTDWTGGNAAVASVATPVRSGAGAMRLTAIAGADMSGSTPTGTSGMAVVPGATYRLSGWFRSAVTARSCFVRVRFYTAAGALISTVVSSDVTDSTSGWTQASTTTVAPATAAFAGVSAVVKVPAAGEQHYVDDFFFGIDQYTGHVSEWPVSWPDSSSAVCVVNLTSASRMARLGRGAELRSIVEEEILADGPVADYTLGEPADSTSAADTSGNQAASLTMAGSGTDVVFGNATGPGTDGLTAAEFANGKYLSGPTAIVLPMAANGATIGFFFSTAAGSATSYIVSDASGSIFARVTAGGLLEAGVRSTTITSGATVTDSAVHHGAFKFDAAGTTMTLLLDGVSQGTAAVSDTSIIGLLIGSGFTGAISHVAAFDTTLSNARLAAHSDAGLTGFAGESAGDRITRLAGYGGILAAEVSADPGSSTIGHFDITGMTPIAAMQKVAETENGTLFDARDGTLTFLDRESRYTVSSSFTLDVTAQEVEADLEPKDDDQFVVNDVTATANGVPAGHVVNQTSIDEQGYYRQNLDTVTDDADDALQGANWMVAKGADPAPRYSSVTVDVTNSSAAQAAAVLAADIGTRFTLSNLPDQVESTADLFVEGYTETITATRHTITFNTSPADGYDVWTIEDAVFGQYDAYPIAY